MAALTELAVQHLRLQLGGLLSEARDRDIPVVLVLPPTNLRFAHLEAFSTPGSGDQSTLDRLRTRAETAARSGDGAAARSDLPVGASCHCAQAAMQAVAAE